MKLSNINTQALNNILGSSGLGKKGFVLFRTVKARVITGSLALLTAGGVALGAYTATHTAGNPGNDAVVPTPPPVSMGDSDTGSSDPLEDDQFGILAEGLEIDGLGMQNTMLTVEEQAAKLAEELGATYKGTTYSPAGSDQTWASEDDYNKAKDAGIADAPVGTEKVNYGQNVFIADDGTAFTTEADRDAWNKQLKGEKTGTGEPVVETEGNYYTAPDGSIWTSETEYQNFVNSQNGQSTTPAATEEIVEQGTGYRDPNGDYWTSEAEYLAYIQSLNNDNVQVQKDAAPTNYDDNYYHAPDGSVWVSEAEYLDYVNQTSNTTPAATAEEVSEEDNYYHAPDGTVWVSEAEYLAYMASEAEESKTK